MSEHLHLELGDGSEFEATPDNTALFMYIGAIACYSHVFIVMDEEASTVAYVFSSNNMFVPIANHILEHNYPVHLHLREVAECDEAAYSRMIHREANDLEAGVPEDWV